MQETTENPQAGKPAKKKGKKPGPQKREILLDHEEEFLVAYKILGNVGLAAMRCGISIHTAYHIKAKPAAKKFLDSLSKARLQAAAAEVKRQFRIDATFVHEQVYGTAIEHKPHEHRDIADKVKLLELAAKMLEIIPKDNKQSHSTNIHVGGAAVPPNATAFEVYEADWLREKKEKWAKELEQKHAQPALSAGACDDAPADSSI